jgi:hypothetical protein
VSAFDEGLEAESVTARVLPERRERLGLRVKRERISCSTFFVSGLRAPRTRASCPVSAGAQRDPGATRGAAVSLDDGHDGG